MKICIIVFSTNRMDYLPQALASQALLNFEGHTVDRLIIDDWPDGRNDDAFRWLVNEHGYNQAVLHRINLGVGLTWQEAWDIVSERDYDYIWHQEDDAVILSPINVSEMIEILQGDPKLSQVVLKRQPWYAGEVMCKSEPTDRVSVTFRGEFNGGAYYFSSISSLYSIKMARINYRRWFRENYPTDRVMIGANINEGLIGKVLLEGQGLQALHLKSAQGTPLIQHIGRYTKGRKLLPHEPGFAAFAHINPDIVTTSVVEG